ncbi:hypothetical protein BC936DRAFT_141486 [Jimgerdemannia flammicorona]|uniref:GDP-fucose protein O-fucosyltransferase-domain-containing protein n=1 Tax=Jimgerdemannia flammicorona TaxID=994334 RepID=A0A433A242_9FUNG|nr:hypothetical protein BC936DRAFT_141486 [Jimgerdemannia flammicorona]
MHVLSRAVFASAVAATILISLTYTYHEFSTWPPLTSPQTYATSPQIYVLQLPDPLPIDLGNLLFTTNASTYAAHCGDGWRKVFRRFESQQLRALSGDLTVQAVVWRCTHSGCGGLGDRMRGLLTSFAIALLTDRAFFVDHSFPAELSDSFTFLNPGMDWTYQEELTLGRRVSEVTFLNSQPTWDYQHDDPDVHLRDVDVLIQSTNEYLVHRLLVNPFLATKIRELGLDTIPSSNVPGCFLNYILHPTPAIRRTIRKITGAPTAAATSNNDTALIGIQIRTGSSASWTDPKRVPRQAVKDFFRCAQAVERELLAKRPSLRYVRWFLTSDSEEIVQQAVAKYGADKILTVPGPIVHIDLTSAQEAHDLTKTVVDHLILAGADKLVISRSGFSELAGKRAFKPAFVYPFPVGGCVEGNEVPFQNFKSWPGLKNPPQQQRV